VAPDAIVELDGGQVEGRALLDGARDLPFAGSIVEVLPAAQVPVEVEIVDAATGRHLPARVRFSARDGRYLAPDGHRDEVNPGFFEDVGADLVLGGEPSAYVPGTFSIGLPVGRVGVDVVAGFEREPARLTVDVDPETRRLRIPLGRRLDLRDRGWITADSHVHFLAPSSALLQAAAEDVDVVNLLAAGWGDLFTNVADLPWGSMAEPGGRRVVVGTENRQNVLGHLALLGARRPVVPLASGGPPEGRMAGALTVLLADWADRCRAADGLVVAAHFPLPYAEIAADIVMGKIDAVEAQAFAPGLDDPMILEWYRYLNLGERLPIVAGTDKMSAEVPIGAVRTYTRLAEGPDSTDDVTFAAWADAVRAGRTFVTSGPLLELTVEGREPGHVLRLTGPSRLQVIARVRATQPVVSDLELVVNGRIVAATAAPHGPGTELALDERIDVAHGSWIAARSRSPHVIESAFTTSMAAHTSAVYVEVADLPLPPDPADIAVVEQVIEGTRTWVARIAAVSSPAERERMLAFLDRSLETLRARLDPR